jgi:hypothetical protein
MSSIAASNLSYSSSINRNQILQTVVTSASSNIVTSSSTWISTGLGATINKIKPTSNILIWCNIPIWMYTTDGFACGWRLYRNNVPLTDNIWVGNTGSTHGLGVNASISEWMTSGFSILDNGSSFFGTGGNGGYYELYFNVRSGSASYNFYMGTPGSSARTMTLMEIEK